jgi:hypothetical protein
MKSESPFTTCKKLSEKNQCTDEKAHLLIEHYVNKGNLIKFGHYNTGNNPCDNIYVNLNDLIPTRVILLPNTYEKLEFKYGSFNTKFGNTTLEKSVVFILLLARKFETFISDFANNYLKFKFDDNILIVSTEEDLVEFYIYGSNDQIYEIIKYSKTYLE